MTVEARPAIYMNMSEPKTNNLLGQITRFVFAVGAAALFQTASIGIASADSGKMFYCEKPGENPVYVSFDNIRSYMGQPDANGNRWVCRPEVAP